ncbi:hypothetical protein [Leeuwenhoekiella parthenopeia]|uniref:Uncharacterized protein n=1 Tax=Leeuwenhoekiella parthenopeia TaxID=2890320 RepID=A0ABS8GWK3_9FLAO|nr:hypothetical protein [Leeuwenhoekiella parthenopeia]MCC4213853.1 hypothetical protein [Leeuwenhoekiella parthenopeia]
MKIRLLILILVVSLGIACSSDDDAATQENLEDPVNAFVFDGILFDMQTLWIFDENTQSDEPSKIGFNFFNKTTAQMTSGEDLDDITAIYFALTDDVIKAVTYTNAVDYEFFVEGTISEGSYSRGDAILNYQVTAEQAVAIEVVINRITASEISLDFSFTRNDDEVIYGNYSGTYLNLND